MQILKGIGIALLILIAFPVIGIALDILTWPSILDML
jgi:hypothetical protein